MSIHNITSLYISMTLVIVGNGFFKPNISTLLGNVYSTPEHNHQKDEGYNIFYMGVNIGAFICNFFGAALYVTYGWGAAFFAAGIGMFIGVIIFLLGTKEYAFADVKKPTQPGDMSLGKIGIFILVPALAFGILGYYLYGVTGPKNLHGNLLGSDSNDAFIAACIPVIVFFASLFFRASADEKRPIGAMLAIFAAVVLFWAVFKQNGTALNTWADNYTKREVSGTQKDVFGFLKFAKTLTYAKDSVPKIDAQFRVTKVDNKIVKEFNYPTYFNNEAPKPAENTKIDVWATNLSQSINPGWVVALTPLVVAFFAWLRRKKKEPSTPTKIALGLLISALSVLVMIAAVKAGNNGAEKVSVWWLIGSYGVITIGELFLSPMGLSLVSKLSPVRMTSLMMGGWFLATSIGNKLSGVLASAWDGYENKANYFWLNFFLLLAAAAIMFVMLKWLNKVMKEKGVN
jgi:proton-dependent oligopeptide transporter, POT family